MQGEVRFLQMQKLYGLQLVSVENLIVKKHVQMILDVLVLSSGLMEVQLLNVKRIIQIRSLDSMVE